MPTKTTTKREAQARPAVKDTKVTSVRLSREDWIWLRDVAKRENRSMGGQLRVIVEEARASTPAI